MRLFYIQYLLPKSPSQSAEKSIPMIKTKHLTYYILCASLLASGCAPRQYYHASTVSQPLQNQAYSLPLYRNVSYETTGSISPHMSPSPIPEHRLLSNLSYNIQMGDTVYGIARKYNVDPYEIILLNKMNNPHSLTVGQIILIPAG